MRIMIFRNGIDNNNNDDNNNNNNNNNNNFDKDEQWPKLFIYFHHGEKGDGVKVRK